ncbi:unnamed protein product [marine sediment metagenome]|uniref:Uncharacterized protein n=1 Tax=marine sediment metagenome TaxID=412755 RepID=X1FSN3_9ZZZZ
MADRIYRLDVPRQQNWHNLAMDTLTSQASLVKLPQYSVIPFASL